MTLPKSIADAVLFKNTDSLPEIILKHIIDLHCSIRRRHSDDDIHNKAKNIILICCDHEFEDMAYDNDWDFRDYCDAENFYHEYVEVSAMELQVLLERRVTHQKKHLRRTGIQVVDMKIALALTICQDAPVKLYDWIDSKHDEVYSERRS